MTVAVHNGSAELIGPGKVQLVNAGLGTIYSTFAAPIGFVEPESEYIVDMILPNPDHPNQPSLGTTVLFRDASGTWWRRHLTEPIESVHDDPENSAPTPAERAQYAANALALGGVPTPEPSVPFRAKWHRFWRAGAASLRSRDPTALRPGGCCRRCDVRVPRCPIPVVRLVLDRRDAANVNRLGGVRERRRVSRDHASSTASAGRAPSARSVPWLDLRSVCEVLLLRRGARPGDGCSAVVSRRGDSLSGLCRLADAPHRGVDVTPTLPVRDMGEATRSCEAAGFDVEQNSDDFAFVHVNEQSVFDLDRLEGLDPATNHAGCYIITDEVDDWHARFLAAGLAVTPIEDMPWGMHEFTLTDPSGNNIRVGRTTSTEVS